jgi:hypothetical protein
VHKVKSVRWVVKFQIEPRVWILAGGNQKWTPMRIHEEAFRVYGSRYTGRFIPSHMKDKPRYLRLSGTKGFVRLDRLLGREGPSVR